MTRAPNLPPAGSRVQLVWFGPCRCGDPSHNDNERIPSGTCGTVIDVDDASTIHVRWDNGPNIGLVPGFDIYKEVG
jgi:hypothetical protein